MRLCLKQKALAHSGARALFKAPAVPPAFPLNRGHLVATLMAAPGNGSDPGFLNQLVAYGLKLIAFLFAATEGFSANPPAPASTLPGSLTAWIRVLVSVFAFNAPDYATPHRSRSTKL